MNKSQLERIFSEERLKPYYEKLQDHEKVGNLYKLNIQLSEAFYTSLSVIEITLRNVIHHSCKRYFNDEFWFKNCLPEELVKQVIDTENKIKNIYKTPTSGRIVSELTFGFWTMLFNRKYAPLLWKPLHQVFIHSPHSLRRRAEISPRLNSIRIFRNRIYHYEPIIWNLDVLKHQHNTIIEILNWLDLDIVKWINDIDRLPELLKNK